MSSCGTTTPMDVQNLLDPELLPAIEAFPPLMLNRESLPAMRAARAAPVDGLSDAVARTDHIVVLEGNERLIGATVQVRVEEATAFTLFGSVVTGAQVGVAGTAYQPTRGKEPGAGNEGRRVALPLV